MKHGFTFRQAPDEIPAERSLAVIRPPEPYRPAGRAAKAAVWLSCLSPLAALPFGLDVYTPVWNAVFVLLSLAWIFVLPLRRRFENTFARVMYNLLPLLLRMGHQFARGHIDAAVLLLGLWTVATLLFWSTLQSRRDFIRQVAVTRLCQRSVILLAAFLIVPAFVVLRTELRPADNPPVEAELVTLQPVERLDAAARDEVFRQAGEALTALSPEEWVKRQPEEHLEPLQHFARAVCAALNCGNEIGAVCAGELPEDWAASYNRQDRTITISAALLGGATPEPALKAVLCAVYHSCEWELIEQTDEDQCGDLIRSWKHGLRPDEPDRIGFSADDGTAAEQSAHAFADEEIKHVMQRVDALHKTEN